MIFRKMGNAGWIMQWLGFALIGASLVPFAQREAAAAEWKPERPVEIITGAAAGGNLDITARAIQKIWQDRKMVANAVVINKPGGAGTIASAYLSQHAGDAHYLMTLSMTLFTSQIMGHANSTCNMRWGYARRRGCGGVSISLRPRPSRTAVMLGAVCAWCVMRHIGRSARFELARALPARC